MKKTVKTTILWILAAGMLLLSTCSNPVQSGGGRGGSAVGGGINSTGGEKGTVTIIIGDESSRAVPPGVTDLTLLDHTIKITDSRGNSQVETGIKIDTPVSFTVATGPCVVMVEAFLSGTLVAVGYGTTNVRAAATNNVSIIMGPPDSTPPPVTPPVIPPVISISISPSNVNLNRGDTQQFAAPVSGTTNQSVTWGISGGDGTSTIVNGLLTVGASETLGDVLTITATSIADNTKSVAATVTVSNLAALTGTLTITGCCPPGPGVDEWVNATLTATFTGSGTGVATIQWRRNGGDIPGAVGNTYVVVDADRGTVISALIQYNGNTGFVASANSFSIRDITGIYTQAHLAAINTNVTTRAGNYFLVNDLVLSGNWSPIGPGTGTNAFSGVFDGGGYTISNLTISTTANYQGLFGYVNGGTVKNLGLINCNISGGQFIGGIAGYVISGGIIQNCYVSGSVSGSGTDTGGIVGHLQGGTVQNCYAMGTVSGSTNVGGVVGIKANIAGVIVQGCIALNQSITATGTAGRVVGSGSSGMSNNYAWDNMPVNGSTVTGGTAANGNGLNVTDANLKTQTTWETPGPGFVFGASVGQWIWNGASGTPTIRTGGTPATVVIWPAYLY